MIETYDLISLGEVMLRLSPPRHERLRAARCLDVRVSGSQLNVAANLARLGLRTAFISALPDNELGQLAFDTCLSYGVEMRHVRRVAGARMGVNYVEFGAMPRPGVAVYDRAGSAASQLQPGEVDWSALVAQTRLAYTDGIFPGLGPNCLTAAQAFLAAARQLQRQTAFDLNYREHLWTPTAARAAWSTLLPYVDVLAANRDVSEQVFGFHGTDADLLRQYQAEFGCRIVCLTTRGTRGMWHGSFSSLALEGDQSAAAGPVEFEIVDRFGAGDAWLAGLLYGQLGGLGLTEALHHANALCALAHTIDGDVIQVSADELRALVESGPSLRVRR